MLRKFNILFTTFVKQNSFKHNLLLAFAFGAVNALSIAPIGFFPIITITLYAFININKQAINKKQAFLFGWAFGAGFFIFSLYWITYALFTDIYSWWWAVPFSLIIAPTLLGLYYGFIPVISFRYKNHTDLYIISTCFAFALIEYLRGILFTGFPWNIAGYSWQHILPILQINAYIGIYGLTLLTYLWAAIFIIENSKIKKALIVSFIIAASLGTYRISATQLEKYPDVAVRIVQPNIDQTVKWNPETREKNLQTLLDITSAKSKENLPIKFVIWPESSTLYRLNQATNMLALTGSYLPEGSIGLFGSINAEGDIYEPDIFNSVTFVSEYGDLITSYNKHHLVPFGEYMPFRNIINITPFANALALIGDFTKGDGVKTIHLNDNLPSPSPLICYEVIFPNKVADRNNRPDWLVNVTNDAWYGNSAGPYQHFEISRIRAIEEGLSLVRAANTGISAIINPLGITEQKLSLGTQGKIDVLLTKPLTATLFSKLGNLPFLISLLTLLIICEINLRKKLKS